MEYYTGTGGLVKKYNYEYEKILFHSIENNVPIHTSLDYPNIHKYFKNAYPVRVASSGFVPEYNSSNIP